MRIQLPSVESSLKNNYTQAIAYVDYQNIFDLLKSYGTNPLEIGFFRVIQEKMKSYGLNVIDFIAYGDFEKNAETAKEQTYLRNLGLQTCHSSIHGKNSSDMELTVDALRILYKNPSIQTFVFITNDRDIIPLLKAIKYENKCAYILSTKTGFNKTIAEYAAFHQYLEDILNLNPASNLKIFPNEVTRFRVHCRIQQISRTSARTRLPANSRARARILCISSTPLGVNNLNGLAGSRFNLTEPDTEKTPAQTTPVYDLADNIDETAIARAREVSEYFYRSNIWKKYMKYEEPIKLNGYIHVIAKIIKRTPDELLNDFKVAHYLKYVTIYNQAQQLYIKQGPGKDTLMLKTG